MTRKLEKKPDKRVQIKGKDTYKARHSVPNDNSADYFISIHCDGQGSFKPTGAFILYPRDKDTNSIGSDIDKSKQFALNIAHNYQALWLDSTPTRAPANNDGKYVLKAGNKTQRRILVELGRMTHPKDILRMYKPGVKNEIARNLAKGIEANIKKYEKE